MNSMPAHSWLEIDRDGFEHNLRRLLELLGGGARLCAVLKADAYGHGLTLLLPTLVKLQVPAIGITDNAEAQLTRAAGFKGRLLRLRLADPEEVAEGAAFGLEELAGDLDVARRMAEVGRRRREPIPFHLALNAGGMSRSGIDLTRAQGREAALAILGLPWLRPVGIMTHFPVRQREDGLRCLQVFREESAWLIAQGRLDRGQLTLHCANSFATQNVPEARLDMVRSGGLLYQPLSAGPASGGVRRVAQFKSRVAAVQAYPEGNTVSYDRTCTLRRDSRLANIPVGYSDGMRCLPANGGSVLIRGRRCAILGKVTMNTVLADVTDHPEIHPGDEVVLFGRQGNEEITLEAFAGQAGCACWEEVIVTVGNLNPRVLLDPPQAPDGPPVITLGARSPGPARSVPRRDSGADWRTCPGTPAP
jgi:alanine racemase